MAYPYSVIRQTWMIPFLQATGATGDSQLEFIMDFDGEVIGATAAAEVNGASTNWLIQISNGAQDMLSTLISIGNAIADGAGAEGTVTATQATREFSDGQTLSMDVDTVPGSGSPIGLVVLVTVRGR